MNLKSYVWRNKDNKIIMSYSLRFGTIYVHDRKTTFEDVDNFKKFLLEKDFVVLQVI